MPVCSSLIERTLLIEEVSNTMSETQKFYVDVIIGGVELTPRAVLLLEDAMDTNGAHVYMFSGQEGETGNVFVAVECVEADTMTASWVAISLCEVFETPIKNKISSINVRNSEIFDSEG